MLAQGQRLNNKFEARNPKVEAIWKWTKERMLQQSRARLSFEFSRIFEIEADYLKSSCPS
jgi:hypothetical protein